MSERRLIVPTRQPRAVVSSEGEAAVQVLQESLRHRHRDLARRMVHVNRATAEMHARMAGMSLEDALR